MSELKMPSIRTSPSGFAVATIGFGTWQFGSQEGDYWGLEYTQEMANRMVQLAAQAGITYFDTAEDYSGGASERQLGVAVKALDSKTRDKVVIGSKILPNHCGDVEQYCLATLERLQLDCIDLYMVHWPIDVNSMAHFAAHIEEGEARDYSKTAEVKEVPPTVTAFQALKRLQQEGKIKHIGVSNFGVEQLTEALSTGVTIAVNQLCYNLLFRGAEFEIMPFCVEHGIGVLAYSPLLQGILTDRWKNANDIPIMRARSRHFRGTRPNSRHGEEGHEVLLFQTLDSIRAITVEAKMSMAELAIAWPLRKHPTLVLSVIAGATKESHVNGNVASVLKADSISDAIMEALDKATDALKQAMGSNCDMWQGGDNGRIR